LLKVENLSKVYQIKDGRVEALKGVSFTTRDGEILGIVGKSGSGKSTLMKIPGGCSWRENRTAPPYCSSRRGLSPRVPGSDEVAGSVGTGLIFRPISRFRSVEGLNCWMSAEGSARRNATLDEESPKNLRQIPELSR